MDHNFFGTNYTFLMVDVINNTFVLIAILNNL